MVLGVKFDKPLRIVCKVCNVEKSSKEFYKSFKTKTGFHGKCKVCQCNANREYRSKLCQ